MMILLKVKVAFRPSDCIAVLNAPGMNCVEGLNQLYCSLEGLSSGCEFREKCKASIEALCDICTKSVDASESTQRKGKIEKSQGSHTPQKVNEIKVQGKESIFVN